MSEKPRKVFEFNLPGLFVTDKMENVSRQLKYINPILDKTKKIHYDFPLGDTYIITLDNGDNTYDVIKFGGEEFNYSAGSIALDLNKATNELGLMQRVPSISTSRSSKLNKGDVVNVAFYDRSKQKPYIRTLVKRGNVVIRDAVVPSGLNFWSQAEGSPGLTRSLLSSKINPAGGAIPLWAGNSYSPPLGIVVTGEGIPITAQAVKNDSGVFTLVHLYFLPAEATYTYSAALGFMADQFSGYDNIFTNYDGNLVFLAIPEGPQFFRKRANLFEEVSFTSLDTDNFFPQSLNMSSLGTISHGAYLRNFASTTAQTGGSRFSAPVIAPLGSNTLSVNTLIQAWALNTSNTTITQAWSVNPDSFLTIDRPLTFGCKTALPSKDSEIRVWISGREQLDAAGTNLDQNLCNPSLFSFPGSDTSRPNYAPQFSRNLQAKIVTLNAITGVTLWSYSITKASTAPVIDTGLLENLTAKLTELGEGQTGEGEGTTINYYTSVGRITEGQLPSEGPQNTYEGTDHGLYYPHTGYSVPQFSVFYRTGLILLPQGTANDHRPTLMDYLAPYASGEIRNFETFTEYGMEESIRIDSELDTVCRNNQDGQLVVNTEGQTYAAYLSPKGLLAGGTLTYNRFGGAGTSLGSFGYSQNIPQTYWCETTLHRERWWLVPLGPDGLDWDSAVQYIIDATGDPPFPIAEDGSEGVWVLGAPGDPTTSEVYSTVGHCPDLFHVYERFIIKLSSAGALLWTCDLTQLVSGCSWYMTETSIGGFSDTIVGGIASTALPLADNIWQMSPVGRILSCLVDYHDLGPNFYPTTKLTILNDSTGAVVHTLPLWTDTSLLTEDVFETQTANQTFIGDGLQYVFMLDLHGLGTVESIVDVTLDGFETSSWFQDGNNLELTFTPDPGVEISCNYNYIIGTQYLVGERKYAITGSSMELRSGAASSVEWIAVFFTETDRSTGTANNRLAIVETKTTLSDTPTVTFYENDNINLPYHVAISGGHLLHIKFDAGAWGIEQI